jgi:hypothetical protein
MHTVVGGHRGYDRLTMPAAADTIRAGGGQVCGPGRAVLSQTGTLVRATSTRRIREGDRSPEYPKVNTPLPVRLGLAGRAGGTIGPSRHTSGGDS